ncbi:flagellar hook-associated protein FlgK [Bartonella sp. TP]|uniref:flagellar hook-associated protein FlgK n=1 Tax=Bartonella sp. TP TaxID=3057550 RepID=UPI0025B128E9|nr:flagellar hook-associated protein FlgK [Bartonella sp. TP]WJW80261.1 flagellar hook-associated protein FlgK [Bartonella sp. TP]
MGLSEALNIARNSLDNSQRRMSVISQNLSGVHNPDYTHRTVKLHMMIGGGAHAVLERDANEALLTDYLMKSSRANGSATLAAGLKQLNGIYASDEFGGSPAAALAKLKASMQFYVNQKTSFPAAEDVVAKAQTLADSLNFGAKQIEKLRKDADAEIGQNVTQIRDLLKKLETLQRQISSATDSNLATYLDQQDSVLKDLSSHIAITIERKENGVVAVYAANGVTLFNKVASKVEYKPTLPLVAGEKGNEVKIDGMPLSHSAFIKPNGDGSLGNLVKFRDDICLKYQSQLDNIANGLKKIFATSGLFTVDTPGIPGMAWRIKVDNKFITSEGGNAVTKLSKSDLQKLIGALDKPMEREASLLSTSTGLEENQSLLDFAKSSLGWVGGVYQHSQQDAEYSGTMFAHAEEFLSNATGVNKDDELSLMLEVEQSYGASAKLVSAVGKMMDDLLAAIR